MIEYLTTKKTVPDFNFLVENRKHLADLYFKGVGEKEVLKEYLENERYPSEQFLEEYTKLDNLVKSIARIVFP